MLRRIAVALPLLVGTAAAQTSSPLDERIDRPEKRMRQLEEKYDRDIKARDEEIARLRAATRPSATAATPSSAASNSSHGAVYQQLWVETSLQSLPPCS